MRCGGEGTVGGVDGTGPVGGLPHPLHPDAGGVEHLVVGVHRQPAQPRL
jgi:hypothetical protein